MTVPPITWDLGEIAAVTGGTVVGDDSSIVTDVTIDSRTVPTGAVFVALRGERHDAHAFVSDAIVEGATAVVVERGRGIEVAPRIEVDNTTTALRDIGALRRAQLRLPTAAVTGSTGKTSTKDLLAAVLPAAWASPRSFNNEVGVPLTILRTPRDARHLVVEVGSRGPGHIAWLGPVIRPDVAVVTNLGVVHLETFGTTDALAESKWELVELLGANGTAVLPVDEPRLDRRHRGTTITFGIGRGDVRVEKIVTDAGGKPSFDLVADGQQTRVSLQMAGAHQAINAAAATAASIALGVTFTRIADGLEKATGSAWRMEVHSGRFTVVNDAYNANPQSMDGALRTVSAMPGRHLAVLGEMAELGPVTGAEHERVGRLVRELGFAAVITVGDDHGMAHAAGDIAESIESAEAALEAVRRHLRDGDVVLVKASRAVGLEALAADLVAEAAS